MYEVRIVLIKDAGTDCEQEIRRRFLVYYDAKTDAIRAFENVCKASKVMLEIMK